MKALSLRQPWALLIVRGDKIIETRWWDETYSARRQAATLIGQRIAIHASTWQDVDDDLDYLAEEWEIDLDHDDLAFGAVLGTAHLAEARLLSFKDDAFALCECTHKFGLIFDDPRRLPAPVPFKGMLGFFNVPERLCRQES